MLLHLSHSFDLLFLFLLSSFIYHLYIILFLLFIWMCRDDISQIIVCGNLILDGIFCINPKKLANWWTKIVGIIHERANHNKDVDQEMFNRMESSNAVSQIRAPSRGSREQFWDMVPEVWRQCFKPAFSQRHWKFATFSVGLECYAQFSARISPKAADRDELGRNWKSSEGLIQFKKTLFHRRWE